MRVIPLYGKFFVSGNRTKNGKSEYLCTKTTLSRAIRIAHKYEKRGWYSIMICDDKTNNVIYFTIKSQSIRIGGYKYEDYKY